MNDSSAEKNRRFAAPHPRLVLRKYLPLVREDLLATYSRDLHKCLLIAPVIGIVTGLMITGLVIVILRWIWPRLLWYDIHHHWAILPTMLAGFAIAGVMMQLFTSDPDEHSTEEIIRSYHEKQAAIDFRGFVPKLLAAIATV